MIASKHINALCIGAICLAAAIVVALVIALSANGLVFAGQNLQYENKIFDKSKVHSLDIQIEDWDSFIQNAQSENYSKCDVIIDGEKFESVAIRAKGNNTLRTVASSNSNRYSFKIEFDHYSDSQYYYGLDKLVLNNCIDDASYMKDYLTYNLMSEFGVPAPLCSYTDISVNGQRWGLYLAVEGVEQSFMTRNGLSGNLYKPDSMDMGGGKGNGKDFDESKMKQDANTETENGNNSPSRSGGNSNNSNGSNSESSASKGSNMNNANDSNNSSGTSAGSDTNVNNNAADTGNNPGKGGDAGGKMTAPGIDKSAGNGVGGGMTAPGGGAGGAGGGMSSKDVLLQYIDDNISSYSNIFNNAKTDVSKADKKRLINSLKEMADVVENGGDISDTVNVDEVIRYFVVHNFVVNADSYTGTMVHNYYLNENNGQLAMIPWDYNDAFGSFMGGGNATSAVNDPIDTPLSVTGDGSRPMFEWIMSNDTYKQKYHQYFINFLSKTNISDTIEKTASLIAPYVKDDPTAFYTYEQFQNGVQTLKTFCEKRKLSCNGQALGLIPSTDEGQKADSSRLIDASDINLNSTMGARKGK